jgi:hypothetical protein
MIAGRGISFQSAILILKEPLQNRRQKTLLLLPNIINSSIPITTNLFKGVELWVPEEIGKQPVGRESGAHPAISISIIPSLNCERYQLPPSQGYKGRVPRIDESWNTANPQPA